MNSGYVSYVLHSMTIVQICLSAYLTTYLYTYMHACMHIRWICLCPHFGCRNCKVTFQTHSSYSNCVAFRQCDFTLAGRPARPRARMTSRRHTRAPKHVTSMSCSCLGRTGIEPCILNDCKNAYSI